MEGRKQFVMHDVVVRSVSFFLLAPTYRDVPMGSTSLCLSVQLVCAAAQLEARGPGPAMRKAGSGSLGGAAVQVVCTAKVVSRKGGRKFEVSVGTSVGT